MYFIQHWFTMLKIDVIEPRTVAEYAFTARAAILLRRLNILSSLIISLGFFREAFVNNENIYSNIFVRQIWNIHCWKGLENAPFSQFLLKFFTIHRFAYVFLENLLDFDIKFSRKFLRNSEKFRSYPKKSVQPLSSPWCPHSNVN